MSIQTIDNSTGALTYLREELAKGLTLAKLVLRTTDFDRGTFFAGLPPNYDHGRLNFRASMPGIAREHMALAHMIKVFIDKPHCATLLEDTMPMTSDLQNIDSRYRARVKTFRDELYWSISGPSTPEDEVFALIGQPILPYPASLFFYRSATSQAPPKLSEPDLQNIANSLVGIAVHAFDSLSFLIWWREDKHPFPQL
jgi:hypothetical protein